MVDVHEYINGLKSYNYYVKERQKAINEYNSIEERLKILDEYVSPSAVTTVEITKFRNGKVVKEKVAAPKSSPDPMRKERTKANYIERQCELIEKQRYYQNKIDEVLGITKSIPNGLREMVWDVYVKHKAKYYAPKYNVSESSMYRIVRDRLVIYFETSTNSQSKNFVE